MKNLFLVILTVISVATQAFADIAVNEVNPTCTEPTIGATINEANLQAEWTANTINLEWYNGKEKLSVQDDAKTCTYDSEITVPTVELSKTGYTFSGWIIKPPFDLSTLDLSINTSTKAYRPYSYACYYFDNGSGGQVSCSDDRVNDLQVGETKAIYSYGTIKVQTLCSPTQGYSDSIGVPDETSTGNYCWCKVAGFKESEGGYYRRVQPSYWVYASKRDGNCETQCPGDCGYVATRRSGRNSLYRRKN